jgi:hypothetical protein
MYKVTRTAAAKIRAVVRMEGTVLASETLMGAASVSDETHPAIPKYQLKADPLAFGKADAELSAAAIEDAASKAGELLNDACSRWRTDILSRARQSGAAAKDEALEDFILSLFVEPGPPVPEAVEFIQQHRGFSDIPALLGKSK